MREAISIAAIFGLAATLLFVGIFASDQSPVRYYAQPEAKGNKETATPKERGTKDAPLFMEVVLPKKSEYEAANDEAERQQKAAVERSMVKWTAVAAFAASVAAIVALFQAGFFYRQLDIMAKGVKDAELVAKAALGSLEISRADLISTHRPKIIIRKVRLRGDLTNKKPVVVEYLVCNVGGTDAEILMHKTTIRVLRRRGAKVELLKDKDVLNAVKPGVLKDGALPAGKHLPANTTMPVDTSGPDEIAYDQAWNLFDGVTEYTDKGQIELIFTGAIHYRDGNGIERLTDFWRTYNRVNGEWERHPSPDRDHEDFQRDPEPKG